MGRGSHLRFLTPRKRTLPDPGMAALLCLGAEAQTLGVSAAGLPQGATLEQPPDPWAGRPQVAPTGPWPVAGSPRAALPLPFQKALGTAQQDTCAPDPSSLTLPPHPGHSRPFVDRRIAQCPLCQPLSQVATAQACCVSRPRATVLCRCPAVATWAEPSVNPRAWLLHLPLPLLGEKGTQVRGAWAVGRTAGGRRAWCVPGAGTPRVLGTHRKGALRRVVSFAP